MLMIVAHHYVYHSGFADIMSEESSNTLFLLLYGVWGKVGINCFVMITGYFMCQSNITLRKFVKLLGEICFYKLLLYVIFAAAGQEPVGITKIFFRGILPFWGIGANFVGCFLVFWLTIPFWNILIQHLTQRQHAYLLTLLLGVYTFAGSMKGFDVQYNYVTWFGVIYLIASYIRLYPHPLFERKNVWALLTVASVLLAMASIYVMLMLGKDLHTIMFDSLVFDTNKLFAVVVAVCSFLWFKNIRLAYNKWINIIGASTFGVLLIHDDSRISPWLWKETLGCAEHYSLSTSHLVLYSLATVLLVFTVCILIDRLRILLIERPFLKWFDKHAPQLQSYLQKTK